MKLSAKITTATFLAAMALGAASLTGGCTVTSTTSNDTDGGTSSSGGSSSGGSSGGSSSGGSSGTTDGGAQCTDNTKQTSKFTTPDYGASCQACAESKCCDKLTACFGQAPDGGVDCNAYKICIDTCNAKFDNDAARVQCYTDEGCEDAADQAVKTAFEVLTQCLGDSCATECAAP